MRSKQRHKKWRKITHHLDKVGETNWEDEMALDEWVSSQLECIWTVLSARGAASANVFPHPLLSGTVGSDADDLRLPEPVSSVEVSDEQFFKDLASFLTEDPIEPLPVVHPDDVEAVVCSMVPEKEVTTAAPDGLTQPAEALLTVYPTAGDDDGHSTDGSYSGPDEK